MVAESMRLPRTKFMAQGEGECRQLLEVIALLSNTIVCTVLISDVRKMVIFHPDFRVKNNKLPIPFFTM